MPLDEISVEKSGYESTRSAGAVSEATGDGESRVMFSDKEIRAQLEAIGYQNVPDYQLRLFREDLEMLICYEQAKLKAPGEFTKPPPPGSPPHDDEGTDAEAKKKKKQKLRRSKSKSPDFCTRSLPFDQSKRSTSPALSDSTRYSGARPARWHRRKVLRHVDGVPVVCEEPLTDAETDLTALSDRFQSLPMEDTTDQGTEGTRPLSWGADCPIINTVRAKDPRSIRHPAKESSKKGKVSRSDYYDEIVRYLPKSFVEHPEPYRPLKKMAPFERYKMYQQFWSSCRIPGESPDQELRWCIRALLLTKRCPDVQVYALKKKDAVDHAKRLKESNFFV